MAEFGMKGMVVAGPLANVSIMYRNLNYIADLVFPIVPAPGDAKIARYLKGAWFRDEAGIRERGTRSDRGGFPADYVAINPKEYSWASQVTTEDREDAEKIGAPPMAPDQDAVEFSTDKVDIRKERRVAEIVFGGGWSDLPYGVDVHGKWAAGEGNTFLKTMREGSEYIRSRTGMRPNRLLLSANTLGEIKEEPTVLDKIKYTERGILTVNLLAALLELEMVTIGDAVFSRARERKDGLDFEAVDVWEKNKGKGSAFLYYAPRKPGLKMPSAGYMARVPYKSGQKLVRMWEEPAEDQDVYEVRERLDICQTGKDLGILYVDTIVD